MTRSYHFVLPILMAGAVGVFSGCTKTPVEQETAQTGAAEQGSGLNAQEMTTETTQQDNDIAPLGPVEERSLPDQWADKAYLIENGREKGEVLGKVRQGDKVSNVIRIGTVQSWANETSIDQFAARAAKYARAMSDVTGKAYCGHICSAPNAAKGGPWAVDMLTLDTGAYCPLIPVCSVPNGSGIVPYGEPVGAGLHINIRPLAATEEQGERSNETGLTSSQSRQTFDFFTQSGQRIDIKTDLRQTGYYYLMDIHRLGFVPAGQAPRVVYNFQTNTAAENSGQLEK